MKKIFLPLLLLLPVLLPAQQTTKNFIDQPYIEVTGTAEMEVVPDLFYLKILINEQDSKNKTALADAEKKMLEKLTGLGVDINKDLFIKDISSDFKKYILQGKEIILQKEYRLTLRDPGTVARTFIELEKIGISNISIESVENSRITEYRKEVKISAIKAAHEKAGYLADAIGQESGKALYIQELNSSYQNENYANSFVVRGYFAEENAMPEFDFEKIKLEYSVLCRFELK
ncbi:MAG: SIMPL domain-containing protein [Bacteroidota bacterium]